MDILDEGSNGRSLRVVTGEQFQIRLDEKPTSGFRWELVATGAPVCTLVGDAFEGGTTTPPGKSGRRVWTFEVVRDGEAAIELAARRAWEGAPAARTFQVRVVASISR